MESWTTAPASVTVVLSGVLYLITRGVLVTKGHHEEVVTNLVEELHKTAAERDLYRTKLFDTLPLANRAATKAEEAIDLVAGSRRRGAT